jgi:hypothetical protein
MLERLKRFLCRDEVRSWFETFLATFLSVFGLELLLLFEQFQTVSGGLAAMAAVILLSVAGATVRSLIKALQYMLFGDKYPLRRSSE